MKLAECKYYGRSQKETKKPKPIYNFGEDELFRASSKLGKVSLIIPWT